MIRFGSSKTSGVADLLCILFLHGSGASGCSSGLGHWVSRYAGTDPPSGGSIDRFGRCSHLDSSPT